MLLTFFRVCSLFLLVTAMLTTLHLPSNSIADDTKPIPRFASLKKDVVNLRAGPNKRHPIVWVYKKRNLPIKITAEFDVWRRILDHEGATGWVHQRLLSGYRTLIITGKNRTLMDNPGVNSVPVATLETGVIAKISSCNQNWCKVKVKGLKGWLKRGQFWGILEDEILEN